MASTPRPSSARPAAAAARSAAGSARLRNSVTTASSARASRSLARTSRATSSTWAASPRFAPLLAASDASTFARLVSKIGSSIPAWNVQPSPRSMRGENS